ncbi:hypothetical protein H1R20_g8160, partial [Candolleomyces eurysporus]
MLIRLPSGRHSGHLTQRVLKRGSHWDSLRLLKSRNAPLDIHPEVQEALAHNRPVVSLETALVTHGLPFPHCIEVPLAMEANVRSSGAIPATIGFVDGRVKVGLERHELERLANRVHKPVKVSRRDVAATIATRKDGGTTCSSTLIFSALAGIKVFATGGMGGVHRGGENSLDISADLHELSRCPVGLVSSGVKSILDIKRTLEYMETLGVPVVAYSETNDFPAFFSTKSGFKVPWNTANPKIAAEILHDQWRLGMENGVMFAVPIPEDYHEVGETIEQHISQAISESEQNGMADAGNDVTPWLLNRIRELSGGQSLESNIALLKNNALVGGRIAVQYSQLQGASATFQPSEPHSVKKDATVEPNVFQDTAKSPGLSELHPKPANVVVVGCAAIDIIAQGKRDVNPALAPHSTIPGTVNLTLGGVARNIAEAATRVTSTAYPGTSSLLVAPIGEDSFGHILAEQISRSGMRTDGLVPMHEHTAVCNMVLDGQGALIGGVSDMDITDNFSPDSLQRHTPEFVVFDGNLKSDTIKRLVDHTHKHGIKALFEPTSVYKSSRILPAVKAAIDQGSTQAPITHFTPNILELLEVYQQAQSEDYDLMASGWWWSCIDNLSLGSNFRMELEQLARRSVDDADTSKGTLAFLIDQGIAQIAVNLLPFFQHIWIKCGPNGAIAVMHIPGNVAASTGFASQKSNIAKRCVVAHGRNKDIVVLRHFPAFKVESPTNVTGAGDSFVGTLIAGISNEGNQIYDPQES